MTIDTVIVAGAPDTQLTPFLPRLQRAQLMIAADSGANALRKVKVVPHCVVGDFDSLHAVTRRWLKKADPPVEMHHLPQQKDETDLEAALLLAVARGADPIDIIGAIGGRLDHTLANITMLLMEELRGRCVRLLGVTQEVRVVRGGEHYTLHGQPHDTVSLLPLPPAAHGITLEGFYYPLHDATLYASHARGVSNILTQPTGHIRVGEGSLLVMHYFDQGSHQWRQYQHERGNAADEPAPSL